ncbi:hypothetical protein IFM89_015575 [Coptis chinensis]|uniref:Uncharacterized protein n=1 Tax=Coptis chinensis TaxID=261450 RepID=A0A835HYL7_9MAGN|nr:hypothetical protein IFM89_015575 [Coptis chinensis]
MRIQRHQVGTCVEAIRHFSDFAARVAKLYPEYKVPRWDRKARVVVVTLEKIDKKGWGAMKSIKTWKRLDDQNLTTIDPQLWLKSSVGEVWTRFDE